jgi:MATE family multidrug resistance protein
MIILITVDTVMAGHAGSSELAHYGLALAAHMPLFVISLGLMTGTPVLISQADGAGRYQRCGPIWRKALVLAVLFGFVTGVMMQFGGPFFRMIGQTPELAGGAAGPLAMFGYGMPGMLIFIASSFFLEAIGRPRFVTLVALSANLLNAGLNWIFIDGNLGAPAMGASGAALATSITRWVMALALVVYAFAMRDADKYGVRPGRGERDGARLSYLLRIGLPYGMAIGFETLAFSTVANFAGLLGETQLAGYQAAMNATTFVFMVSLGIMIAASIRVGNAVGRRDRKGMALAGWTGLGIAWAAMILFSILLQIGPHRVAGFYSDDPAVLSVTVSALGIVAYFILVDSTQAVMLGALRGAGDVIVPTVMHLISFWVVAVPLSWYLGLKSGLGVSGLFLGMSAGLVLAALFLSIRFHIVSRREIRAFD